MASPGTQLPLAPSRPDLRFLLLGLAFVPWIIWIAGVVLWIMQWPQGYGFASFVVCAVIGFQVVKLTNSWMYRTARGFLPVGFDARPGQNFLCFELEEVATAHKFKLVAEETGVIFPYQGQLHIRTPLRDIVIPPECLRMETYRPNGKTQGVLLSWSEHPGAELSTGVAFFKYIGSQIEIAGELEQKAKWAQDIINGWRVRRVGSMQPES